MKPIFRRVAVIGKYRDPAAGAPARGSRQIIEGIARLIVAQGGEATLEAETAATLGITGYQVLTMALACIMTCAWWSEATAPCWAAGWLRTGRRALVGINKGRLAFITDIPLQSYELPDRHIARRVRGGRVP